ncbi:hypothetical protein [Fructilactobacillus frigidiflavus]|uniref:hypothetical protein n=1 Tax=Fructilactobacillus frigidiflavus TaxID=3242688 RepID=UPI0037572FF2
MKKKYILSILIVILIVLLGLGWFFTINHSSKNSSSNVKENKISKSTKSTKQSKNVIPNEYIGTWYQKDQKFKVTGDSFEIPNLNTDSNNKFKYTLTKNSKPMPLDVYSKEGMQYFWKGSLMSDGNDKNNSVYWKKDGGTMSFWLAKMTIDGKKQTVLASFESGQIFVWTNKETAKNYSFELGENVSPTQLPIKDLDKLKSGNDSSKGKNNDGKVPSQFLGTWYDGNEKGLVISPNKIKTADGKSIILDVSKNSNGTYHLGAIDDTDKPVSQNYSVSSGNYWVTNYNVDGKNQKVVAVVYKGSLEKSDDSIDVQILTSSPNSKEISTKINKNQIGKPNLSDDSNKDTNYSPLTFKEAVDYELSANGSPTTSDYEKYYGDEKPYGDGGWYFRDISGVEHYVVPIGDGSKISIKDVPTNDFDAPHAYTVDR